jgi:inner membrane protein
MNGPAHQLAGAAVALAVTLNDDPEKTSPLHHPLAAIPTGAFLGKVPDWLEPALKNPNHRQFFHSILTLGLVGVGTYKIYQWEPKDNFEKIIRGLLLIGGVAYLSHLVLDATTRRSLPLVGNL